MTQSVDLAVPPSGHPDEESRADAVESASALAQKVVDIDLAERVERALRISGYAPLRAIEVTVCAGVVILRGQVSSYHMKQLAQVIAMDVPVVRELRNDVEVVRPS
jgi:osmotically-inducible protein OsmY